MTAKALLLYEIFRHHESRRASCWQESTESAKRRVSITSGCAQPVKTPKPPTTASGKYGFFPALIETPHPQGQPSDLPRLAERAVQLPVYSGYCELLEPSLQGSSGMSSSLCATSTRSATGPTRLTSASSRPRRRRWRAPSWRRAPSRSARLSWSTPSARPGARLRSPELRWRAPLCGGVLSLQGEAAPTAGGAGPRADEGRACPAPRRVRAVLPAGA